MIVTCASCMTKFNLDESRIPAKGAKVRCSKCHHIFFVGPPTEHRVEPAVKLPPSLPTEETPGEDFESFLKSQEALAEATPADRQRPPTRADKAAGIGLAGEQEEMGFPKEEALFREEEAPRRKVPTPPFEPEREEKAGARPFKPKRMIQTKRRKPPIFFLVIIFLALVVLGGFFLWTEFGSKGTVMSYLEYPIQKGIDLWDRILGVKQVGLVVGDLNRYDEKVGDFLLSVIEGKVKNQSGSARRYVKIRVEIFDQNKEKIVEKETLCGLNIGLDGLRSLPPQFFSGDLVIQPQQPQDMVLPSGKEIPFMVVFKDLTSQAREFKVEIVEAPSL